MSQLKPINTVFANWPAPKTIHAFTTTRLGGQSVGPYAGFNLGERCGDDPDCVAENRQRLSLDLPHQPLWLHQVHGTEVLRLPIRDSHQQSTEQALQADAVWTSVPYQVCAVLTADCLPVLLCDQAGTRVAAAHAGWKGLLHGVLERTVEALSCPPDQLLAWMGPAIAQPAFEVGPEVREAFLLQDAEAEQAFIPGRADRWHADIYALARIRLAKLGLNRVFGQPICTYSDPQRFYSFRRDGITGRMASLIWLDTTV
jgi:YfiH family protein